MQFPSMAYALCLTSTADSSVLGKILNFKSLNIKVIAIVLNIIVLLIFRQEVLS